MYSKQSGVTLIGWVIILAIIGVFALAAMRLIPMYTQKMEVYSLLDALHQEFDGQNASAQKLRAALKTKMQVKDISVIKHGDIDVTPVKGGHTVRAAYEHKSPFMGELGLYITVDKEVLIRR